MRITINKSDNRIIEMQSDASPGTLLANAISAGYSADNIEEQEIDENTYKALINAQPETAPAPTLGEIDGKLSAIENAVFSLRAQLNKIKI